MDRSEAEAPTLAPTREEPASSALPDVLVVDDDEKSLEATAALLSELPCRVLRARSGVEALGLLERQDVAVVLVDARMPGMEGFEVAERVRARSRRTPIIFLATRDRTGALLRRAYALGAVDFLTRPIRPRELLRDKVAWFVEERRAVMAERARLGEELRRRADQLAEVDRRRDELLAMLAHELRNPLAPILNGVELLRQEGTPPAVARRALDAADRQVRHLSRLVADLVDASRLRTGEVELRREVVDLVRIVEDAVSAIEPLAREQRRELAVELPRGPVLVDGDPVRLAQVVERLLHNAIKYTTPGGHVRLEVADGEAGVAIRVTDDGAGVGPHLLPRVFETFVQGEQAPDRARGGLGLGLALVKGVVELHGGTVSATSAGPGRGSSFEVRLPPQVRLARGAARERAWERTTGDLPRPPAVSLRVAVIEDNPDIRETLRELLRLRGHEVIEAEDGPDGVQLVLSRDPDVALVDIGLPGLDGYEVASRLREAAGRTRLVALTGYGGEEDRARAVRAGFHAHLVKPVDFEELARLLDRLAGRECRALLEGAAP